MTLEHLDHTGGDDCPACAVMNALKNTIADAMISAGDAGLPTSSVVEVLSRVLAMIIVTHRANDTPIPEIIEHLMVNLMDDCKSVLEETEGEHGVQAEIFRTREAVLKLKAMGLSTRDAERVMGSSPMPPINKIPC